MKVSPIEPSLGRIVWYRERRDDGFLDECPAIITKVWSNNCINVTVFRDMQEPLPKSSVVYSDADNMDGSYSTFCWMPYQLANKPT